MGVPTACCIHTYRTVAKHMYRAWLPRKLGLTVTTAEQLFLKPEWALSQLCMVAMETWINCNYCLTIIPRA